MNPGKRFEKDFKASVPGDVYYLRLHDSAVGFDIKNSTQRFSIKSPYDVVLCRNGKMYAFELKSTNKQSVSFDGSNPMIKEWQVEALESVDQAGGVSGVVLNFRSSAETYFLNIRVFEWLANRVGRKSLNIKDVREWGVRLPEKKLRVNYRYDLSPLWVEE